MVNVLSELKEVITSLDKVDSYFDSMSESMQNVDYKICDLMHLIEDGSLKTNECYRIVRELKKLRQERRRLKNDYQMILTYKNNHSRLNNENNRKLLLGELHKTEKQLGKNYKNRVYTEEEIKNILGGKIK